MWTKYEVPERGLTNVTREKIEQSAAQMRPREVTLRSPCENPSESIVMRFVAGPSLLLLEVCTVSHHTRFLYLFFARVLRAGLEV